MAYLGQWFGSAGCESSVQIQAALLEIQGMAGVRVHRQFGDMVRHSLVHRLLVRVLSSLLNLVILDDPIHQIGAK